MKNARFVLLLAALSCPGTTPPPGDETMGLYGFSAGPIDVDNDPDAGLPCDFVEVPRDAGFNFEAAFSRFRDAGRYFVSIGGVAHDAEFDGQRITATYTAQRNFQKCTCNDGGTRATVTMTETLTATIVSKSQSDAVGGCVELPPYDPDAGIFRPETTTEGGFDAVRACGTLREVVRMEPACVSSCFCQLKYGITGDRR